MAGVLTVHPSIPARSFAEFLVRAKAAPDTFTSGSSGPGSIGQMMIEAMNRDFGIRLRHVPYKGMGPAVIAALSGESQVLFDQYPSSAPHMKAGKMVPIAVGSAARVPNLPNVPTFKELGYPELNEISITWFGLVAPAQTSEPVLRKLNAAVAATLRDPAIRQRMEELNTVPLTTTGAEFGQMIHSSFDRNAKIIKAIGMAGR
jgi:tripartite-type tricarboxylate transporter receptor subunit TctC